MVFASLRNKDDLILYLAALDCSAQMLFPKMKKIAATAAI
jgi:hypothetical protein